VWNLYATRILGRRIERVITHRHHPQDQKGNDQFWRYAIDMQPPPRIIKLVNPNIEAIGIRGV
jgi:hypothetical protein